MYSIEIPGVEISSGQISGMELSGVDISSLKTTAMKIHNTLSHTVEAPRTAIPNMAALPAPTSTGVELPLGFKYATAFLAGRPRHKEWDAFSLRHPKMERTHRAKIFSPFDALDGYGDSIGSKNVEYVEKIEVSEEEKCELDRKLQILGMYTANSRLARKNMIEVRVKYFVPCDDRENFAYELKGRYMEKSGICWKVGLGDDGFIQVDEDRIKLDDVVEITAADERLFDMKIQ